MVADVGAVYCNGIGFAADGSLVWVESYTRMVRSIDEEAEMRTLCQLPEGHVPDGFAVAEDGRLFIATCGSHGISIVSADGEYLGLIGLDAHANPTNCCFRGSDLFITDFGMECESRVDAGRLWAVTTDALGALVNTGVV